MLFPSRYYRRQNNVVELNSKTPRIASVGMYCNTMMPEQLIISPPTVTFPTGKGSQLPEPISAISIQRTSSGFTDTTIKVLFTSSCSKTTSGVLGSCWLGSINPKSMPIFTQRRSFIPQVIVRMSVNFDWKTRNKQVLINNRNVR